MLLQVKGGQISLCQLAEEWLLRSCKILQIPYSSDAYINALKEAEQFLWAGSEMDPVSFKTSVVISSAILDVYISIISCYCDCR